MIDRATIERIMEAANIVDVVSEFVTLRKSGANYKGLCPFHDEKTPSFHVSPSRGICHCFGCGKGGNAVGFIMEHEQMTYPEALRGNRSSARAGSSSTSGLQATSRTSFTTMSTA